jgi:hypothetical protein
MKTWTQYTFYTLEGEIVKQEIIKGKYPKHQISNIIKRLESETGKTILSSSTPI